MAKYQNFIQNEYYNEIKCVQYTPTINLYEKVKIVVKDP